MRWEYQVVQIGGSCLESQLVLNWLGEEGWELVSVEPGEKVIAYLKRPKDENLF